MLDFPIAIRAAHSRKVAFTLGPLALLPPFPPGVEPPFTAGRWKSTDMEPAPKTNKKKKTRREALPIREGVPEATQC